MHTMSEEMQEAAGSAEPACVLCGQADAQPDIYGRQIVVNGIYFHAFCWIFSNIHKKGDDENNCSQHLIHTVRQAEQMLCFVCGKRGAFITCAEMGCDHSFHLPCASEGECITQYFEDFRSFCREHIPRHAVEATPMQDTTCIICMEPVGDSRSYSTMVCPACRHAWFHRACIQGMALNTGLHCFQCPLCRDSDLFLIDMLTMGIRIPNRQPAWEDSDAYMSLGVRHQRCDASDCRYPRGREQAERVGPWQLLLCSSCAAQGTHRCCSNLSHSTTSWECSACAGEDTASSTNLDTAGPNTISQQGLGPSQGPIGQDNSSSGTTNQPDHDSQVSELLSRQTQRARTRSRSPLEHRAADNNSQPQRRRRSRSRRRGPARGRSRTQVPRGAQNINRRPH